MSVDITKIRIDGGTQSRAAINEATVAEYAEAMADPNTVFPPVIVYFDGSEYWLADGFHRLAAWQRMGRTDIPADVRQGSRRQAILHSVAANSAHGLRRSNDDKRRAVLTLLEDAEWVQWSDGEIARRCAVSREFVNRLRASLTCDRITGENASEQSGDEPQTRVYTTKHGTQATMNVEKSARKPAETDVQDVIEPETGAGSEPDRSRDVTPEKEAPEQEPTEPPEVAALRRKFGGLTREALLDDLIGATLDGQKAKATISALKAEVAELQARLDEATQGDMGRALGNAQRRATTLQGRLDETMAGAKRLEYRLKKVEAERDAARSEVENQVIPL